MHGHEIKRSDIAQMFVGSAILGFPVATTEEIWNLGEELSTVRVLLIMLAGLTIIAWVTAHLFYDGKVKGRLGHFVTRVAVVYGLTLAASALILLAVNRFPLDSEPMVAIRRAILVALPASSAAILVDSLH